MKKIYQSIAGWQFLLASLVFIAVVGLAYVYQEQITAIVLVPILYLMWFVDLALQMFGQQCIWVLALIIALILSFVVSHRNETSVPDATRGMENRPAVGRIQFWRRRVRISSNTIDDVSFRGSEFRQLVLQTLAYQENTNIRDIEEQLRSGQIRVPADVSNILGLTDQITVTRPSIGFLESIKLRIRWIIESFAPPEYYPDPRIEKVAEYLENIMEVEDDTRDY
jgi:hypothetical protein